MWEWLSYRPSDFILYSARSWWRTVELANAEAWPTQLLTIALGVAATWAALRRPEPSRRGVVFAWLVFAVCWGWSAWAFHWRHHASINWAAPAFARAFVIEAACLGLVAATVAFGPNAAAIGSRGKPIGAGRPTQPMARRSAPRGVRRTLGGAALVTATVLYPLFAPAFARPWSQAEVFGLAPDPTALATLGLLLVLRPPHSVIAIALWTIPIASLLVSAVTLATMR